MSAQKNGLGILVLAGVVVVAASASAVPRRPHAPDIRLIAQQSGTSALLQDVSAVDSSTVWVGGNAATWAVTTDGGEQWRSAVMPRADSLEFRDVHAVDARTAYLLSSGLGDRSRIYKTADGGASWTLEFTAQNPKAFFDCFAFWDAEHGMAMSDAVDGHFLVITTKDGARWAPVPAASLPPAQPNEGGFAASGTCAMALPPSDGWIGTGNAARARLLRTGNRGATWDAVATPLAADTSEGITSLAVRDARRIVALGGHIARPAAHQDEVAITDDGGRSWTLGGHLPFPGPVYGAAYSRSTDDPWLVAVGPGGAAASNDDGRTWALIDSAAYWSVGFGSARVGWAVGPHGRITRIELPAR
ncbi:MAG: WD40/YVTN/BNR-like repeat-containing protein [Gemmatimonadaceae bacterium]